MLRFEPKLKSIAEKVPSEVNFFELTHKAISNLKNLAQIYMEAAIAGKMAVIGSTFTKKWNFSDLKGRTTYLTKPVEIIYLINKWLKITKTEIKAKNCDYSGFVPLSGNTFNI